MIEKQITAANADEQIRHLRNGFRDTCLYRTYNDITMTIMVMGPGTFTMHDRDEIVGELKQFWWPEDLKEERI